MIVMTGKAMGVLDERRLKALGICFDVFGILER
jgi:hypothetical protein